MNLDPKLDLVINKILDASPEQVWRAWTTPSSFQEWFCPKPWFVSEARIDFKAGGEFFTTMKGPQGEEVSSTGCILEVEPMKRLIWTSALLPGFRPQDSDMPFTAMIVLEPHGINQTKYTAIARHRNEAEARKHSDMGFAEGWGIVADQLAAYSNY